MNKGVVAVAPKDDRVIFLAPSTIRFIDSARKVTTSSDQKGQATITSPQADIHLEAVEVDGQWFALDRDQLEFYQRLERKGECRMVRVEARSITQLSEDSRNEIADTLASIRNGVIPGTDSKVIHGYQILHEGRMDNALNDSLTDLDRHSDSTPDDEDNSSSECDWSEDERDSSDENSDEEFRHKQRLSADGKSDTSSNEHEQLLGEDSRTNEHL